jgi:hypothetical protein
VGRKSCQRWGGIPLIESRHDMKPGQARQDLTDALKAEPGNKDIRRELTNLKAKEVLS